jgi:hypothetical protein
LRTPASELRRLLTRRKVDPNAATSLLGGRPPGPNHAAAEQLVATLAKGTISSAQRRQIEAVATAWLDRAEIDAEAAWEGVALLRALPVIAPLLGDDQLQQLWERWQELSALAGKDTWDDDPLRFALLAIETPLALAAIDDAHGDPLRAAAIAAWNELVTGWLDEQGLPEARYLAAMRPVLASWTRCASREPGLLTEQRRVGFVSLLRQTIRLAESSGREAFSHHADASFLHCLEIATQLAKDREASGLLAALSTGATPRRKAAGDSLSPSVYSESRQIAILRSRLTADSPRLTALFDRPGLQLELSADQPLLSGHWSAELMVDGQQLTPKEAWEETCRHEDEDVEYLELETALGNGWMLQRHILLARQEGFALLADAVLGQREANISYTTSLPLFPGVQLQPERETHEAWLVSGAKRYLALPLALPEWRSDRPLGELACKNQRLTLTTNQRRGRNLFHPLLIPLSGGRRSGEHTWRQLTVGQNLEIQSADIAAAYRAQFGDRQWVVYRALTRGNRTFLGKNLISELFVGVFHRTGEMDAIMEVE